MSEETGPSISATPEVIAEQEELIRKIRHAKNHYQVLDVEQNCTIADATRKFRRLALRLHPDKCDRDGGAEAYGSIDLAHQTITDPEKRKKYDYLLTLHRGRFRPDIDNNNEMPSADDDSEEAPEGGYIWAVVVSFFVIAATVAVWLFDQLKVPTEPDYEHVSHFCTQDEFRGITGKSGLPLQMFAVTFLVTLALGSSLVEVLKWTFVVYFATKGVALVPWRQLIEFQLENYNNMFGVPFFVGFSAVPMGLISLELDLLSALTFGALEMVVLGIAVLRSEGYKWVIVYGAVLFALVYYTGVSGGIAAVLAMVVFYFGGSMPGATIAILGIVILFFAYKISPCVCMLVLMAMCLYLMSAEIIIISCVLCTIIGLWNYGWYLTFAFLLEIYLVKNALAGSSCGKRIAGSLALFVLIHNFNEWGDGSYPILTSLFAVVVFWGLCFVLMRVIKLDESYTQATGYTYTRSKKGGGGPRKQHSEPAGKRDRKEAKRDAKKPGRGKKG